MPACSSVYTNGNTRFFRLAAILHDEGKQLLTLFFKTFYAGKTLSSYLNEPAYKSIIDRALSKHVINPDQYALLYPVGTNTDDHFYDITLLVFLIRSLHPTIPVNDNVWKYPASSDKSVEACVTKLKDVRNKLWGHIYTLEISETDYYRHCRDLQDLFEHIAREIKDPSYTVKSVEERIRGKTSASLDSDAENRLINCLQSWKAFDNQDYLIERLDDIISEVKKLREVGCHTKEVRSIGTSTIDDTQTQLEDKSTSCSSLETVYEQPVSQAGSRISDGYKETISEPLLDAVKYNDASTSTSSLQDKHKLSSRAWAFIMPFIGSPRQSAQASPRPPCQSRKEKTVSKRPPRHRPSPIRSLPCFRSSRRFGHLSKIRTDQHDNLPLKCFISGLVHLMNGLLVMIDTTHNNIQVYDRWCAPIDIYWCRFPIKSVCAFKGDKKVAVTLFKNSSVALFEISRKNGIQYLETIDVHCESWLNDIKYRDGKLYTLCDKSDLHIHHFRSIPDDVIKFDIGVNPLSFDISVTNGRTYLYIAYNDGVLCFTDSGKELWEYRDVKNELHPDFTQLYRHNDRLFISAWATNRIVELTTDGEWVRDIGVGHTSHPWAVEVSRTGEQVFVSQYSVSNNDLSCREVLIFK